MILPISASQIARTIGVNHQHLAKADSYHHTEYRFKGKGAICTVCKLSPHSQWKKKMSIIKIIV
jgi:hypothetical protein